VIKKVKRVPHILLSRWRTLRAKYRDSPHRSFRRTPRLRHRINPVTGAKEAWLLIIETVLFVKKHIVFFLWLMVLYSIVTYLLVGGVSQVDYAQLKQQASPIAGGLDAITRAAAYFGATLTGGLTQSPSDLQRFMSGFLLLLFWLVTIWAVRMMSAGKPVKVRQAFYNGPTPLISTVCVLLVMATQLIPAALGLFALTVAFTQDWINSAVEGLAFGTAAALTCLLSLYWLSGSVIATAIVALPGMYPLQSLADARALTMGKRWVIALRIVAMLVIQLLLWAVILLPTFMLDAWLDLNWLPLVPIMVQVMGGVSVIFSSIYIYKLYRSLL
jgi:hypothetical protein